MTKDDLRALLTAQTDAQIVDREILVSRPWIFDADTSYTTWRSSVAKELSLGPDHVLIVGSAATGFSLSPLKAGRPFRPLPGVDGRTSDIDIALVAPNLFTA